MAPGSGTLRTKNESGVLMKSPDDIANFLQTLSENPEVEAAVRNRTVADDLVQLPKLVQQNQEMLRSLTEQHAEFVQSSVGFMEAVTETNQRLGTLAENHEGHIATVESATEAIRADMATMSGQLNGLIGTDYERKAARRATGLIDRYLNVSSGEALLARTQPDNQALREMVHQAVQAGVVTESEEEDLGRADIILNEWLPGGEDRYVVTEVSITVDEHDVDRAARRARILQSASNTTTLASTISAQGSDTTRERALAANVAVINLDE